jgi:hypothetical protein
MIYTGKNHDPEPSPPRPRWSDDELRLLGTLLASAAAGRDEAIRRVENLLRDAAEARAAASLVEQQIAESLDADLWPDQVVRALVCMGDLPPA